MEGSPKNPSVLKIKSCRSRHAPLLGSDGRDYIKFSTDFEEEDERRETTRTVRCEM